MKKFTVPRIFIMFLIALSGLTLFACNDDRIEVPPVKLEHVKGNYKGRLITVQGNNKTEKVIAFKVKEDTITFEDFPIDEIVKSVVNDPVKAEAALQAMGKVKYNLKYTASVNAENNVVELDFAPEIMELQVPVDGVNKKVDVTLAAKQKGFYVGMDFSLRFALMAEKITVEGTELSPYEVIHYNFPFCIKN